MRLSRRASAQALERVLLATRQQESALGKGCQAGQLPDKGVENNGHEPGQKLAGPSQLQRLRLAHPAGTGSAGEGTHKVNSRVSSKALRYGGLCRQGSEMGPTQDTALPTKLQP